MVTVQVGYFLRIAAFALSTAWLSALMSLWSSSKNTGFKSGLRLSSSSDAPAIGSSRIGSGGTTSGSLTGSGGAGGRAPLVAGPVVGGGIGLVTGGLFL